eukprot:TRINITY_DN59300_c0_g1_i2.p1 TRINITY_DN59300_c0_g1~~TRINITY_DN59300_c0_g1_i2.p1  ORF type:complete len:766 (+),score=99.72 TRINITY_DN59300_c0_g1_i2:125-2299(+)
MIKHFQEEEERAEMLQAEISAKGNSVGLTKMRKNTAPPIHVYDQKLHNLKRLLKHANKDLDCLVEDVTRAQQRNAEQVEELQQMEENQQQDNQSLYASMDRDTLSGTPNSQHHLHPIPIYAANHDTTTITTASCGAMTTNNSSASTNNRTTPSDTTPLLDILNAELHDNHTPLLSPPMGGSKKDNETVWMTLVGITEKTVAAPSAWHYVQQTLAVYTSVPFKALHFLALSRLWESKPTSSVGALCHTIARQSTLDNQLIDSIRNTLQDALENKIPLPPESQTSTADAECEYACSPVVSALCGLVFVHSLVLQSDDALHQLATKDMWIACTGLLARYPHQHHLVSLVCALLLKFCLHNTDLLTLWLKYPRVLQQHLKALKVVGGHPPAPTLLSACTLLQHLSHNRTIASALVSFGGVTLLSSIVERALGHNNGALWATLIARMLATLCNLCVVDTAKTREIMTSNGMVQTTFKSMQQYKDDVGVLVAGHGLLANLASLKANAKYLVSHCGMIGFSMAVMRKHCSNISVQVRCTQLLLAVLSVDKAKLMIQRFGGVLVVVRTCQINGKHDNSSAPTQLVTPSSCVPPQGSSGGTPMVLSSPQTFLFIKLVPTTPTPRALHPSAHQNQSTPPNMYDDLPPPLTQQSSCGNACYNNTVGVAGQKLSAVEQEIVKYFYKHSGKPTPQVTKEDLVTKHVNASTHGFFVVDMFVYTSDSFCTLTPVHLVTH